MFMGNNMWIILILVLLFCCSGNAMGGCNSCGCNSCAGDCGCAE